MGKNTEEKKEVAKVQPIDIARQAPTMILLNWKIKTHSHSHSSASALRSTGQVHYYHNNNNYYYYYYYYFNSGTTPGDERRAVANDRLGLGINNWSNNQTYRSADSIIIIIIIIIIRIRL